MTKRSDRTSTASVLSMSILSIAMVGCSFLNPQPPTPKSQGETLSGYTYVPVDPSKVKISVKDCAINFASFESDATPKQLKLLDMLPDNAVRMSMELSDAHGNVTYGVSKVGAAGSAYKLTADYVNSDTVNKTVWIRRTMVISSKFVSYDSDGKVKERGEKSLRSPVPFGQGSIQDSSSIEKKEGNEVRSIPGTELYDIKSYAERPTKKDLEELRDEKYEEFNVPIYVGIGLRIIAEGVSTSGEANISGIGVVGAEAEAHRLLGSLTVQTLGVNGQAVASALPVQSELSRTTAENAFVAIGAIKAMLHQPETIKSPRVVGLYLPFPGGKPLVNALISELSRNPVTWCPNAYVKDAKDAKDAKETKESPVDQ